MTNQTPQPSWRKPAGALLIVAMIIGWAAAVSTAMDYMPDMPVILTIAIYAVAGILWIYPARLILVWMETGQWTLPTR
jgi:Na+/H+ antiporter NhaB